MDINQISLPDVFTALLLMVSGWLGYLLGLPKLVLWTMKWCGSIAASFFLCPWVANWLSSWLPLSERGSFGLGWVTCFLVVFGLMDFVSQWVHHQVWWKRRHGALRWGGAVMGLLIGLLLSAFLAFAFNNAEQAVLRRAIRESWPARHLAAWAQSVAGSAGVEGVSNEPFGRVEPLYTGTPPQTQMAMANTLLDSVNQLRQRRGLLPLRSYKVLELAALQHAQDMLARSYFSHRSPEGLSPFDRLNKLHIPYLQAGENLALAGSAAEAHAALMNSPGHMENLLRPQFQRVGIVAIRLRRNRVLFVQEFSN